MCTWEMSYWSVVSGIVHVHLGVHSVVLVSIGVVVIINRCYLSLFITYLEWQRCQALGVDHVFRRKASTETEV